MFLFHIRSFVVFRFLLLVGCGFLFFDSARAVSSEKPIHVVTVATDTPLGFRRLVNSCIQNQIHLDVLGLGEPYINHVIKLHLMTKYLEILPEDDLVLFVDGYDVFFLASAEEIASRFLAMEIPFLIGAERALFPEFLKEPRYKDRYPEMPGPFCYLNSGTYIGTVREVKKRIKRGLEFFSLQLADCDQGLFSIDFIEHPEEYRLDFRCDLFFPLFLMLKDEVALEGKKIECLLTGSSPCVLHGNGGIHCYDLYIALYRYFFDDPSLGEGLTDQQIKAQCTFYSNSLEKLKFPRCLQSPKKKAAPIRKILKSKNRKKK